MIKKPDKVVVLGEHITVTYLKDEPAMDFDGLFNPENMSIEIRDTFYWSRSLIHEIVHAAFYVSGITHLLDEDVEESICSCLESALFSIYRLRD